MSQRKPATKESTGKAQGRAPAATTSARSTSSKLVTSKPSTTKPEPTRYAAAKPRSSASKTPIPTAKTPTPPAKNTKAATTNYINKSATNKTQPTTNSVSKKTSARDVGKVGKPKSAGAASTRSVSAKGKGAQPMQKGIAFEIGISSNDLLDRPQSAVPGGVRNRRMSEATKVITKECIEENLQKAEERKKAYDAARMKRINDLDSESKKLTDKVGPYIERELTNSNIGGHNIIK